eukprot:jgi/Mesvir1/23601/Mv18286-RA.1
MASTTTLKFPVAIAATSTARQPAANSTPALKATFLVGKRLATQKVSFRAHAAATHTLRVAAEVCWSLEADKYWCDMTKQWCSDFTLPLDVTSLIDKKRPGPHKTGSITVGGKRTDVDLAIFVNTIAGRHAELEEDGDSGRLFVRDLGSHTGTLVNGHRIEGKVELRPGDHVSFGPEPEFTVLRNTKAHA